MFWEGHLSDEAMGAFAPIVVYWIYSGAYHLLPPLEKYRLHSTKYEEDKNLVSLSSVVKGVLLQQLVQAIVAQLLFFVSIQFCLHMNHSENLGEAIAYSNSISISPLFHKR